MSEEENMPAETAESAEAQAPAAPTLGVNDLKLMANIIEVVSNRGAIKANEMAAVGTLYNNLMSFLIANGAVNVPQPEVADDAPVGEDVAEVEAETTEEETND
jgi:hypothetical protein